MLDQLLQKHKQIVLNLWYEQVLATYPPEARKFFRNQKNPFSNPVGNAISVNLSDIFECILDGRDSAPEIISQFLDNIIRIRAVQEFSPSEALSFVFGLKEAVREAIKDDLGPEELWRELLDWEKRIDRIALLAFEVYSQCRETLFRIRVWEIRNSTDRLWERICRKYGPPAELPESVHEE